MADKKRMSKKELAALKKQTSVKHGIWKGHPYKATFEPTSESEVNVTISHPDSPATKREN